MARSRRVARRPGRVRYSWHGFYQPIRVTTANTNLAVFLLYGSRDQDHQEEVVLERIVGQFSWASSGATDTVGMGLYVVELDTANVLQSDVDPLGNSDFDIEQNNTLFLWQQVVPTVPSGQMPPIYTKDINVKARRKIQDPQALVLVEAPTTASRTNFQFNLRCLIREGRF